MAKTHLLGPWIRRFLLEYVVNERNLARNTQLSYRDTLRLLLPFVSEAIRQPLDQLAIDQLSPPLVQQFLGHLEQQRGCTVATRWHGLPLMSAFPVSCRAALAGRTFPADRISLNCG